MTPGATPYRTRTAPDPEIDILRFYASERRARTLRYLFALGLPAALAVTYLVPASISSRTPAPRRLAEVEAMFASYPRVSQPDFYSPARAMVWRSDGLGLMGCGQTAGYSPCTPLRPVSTPVRPPHL